MQGPRNESADHLESALLSLGRSLPLLAAALEALLPPARLEELVKAAGRRKAGRAEAALVVADGVVGRPRFRLQVVEALLVELPAPRQAPEEAAEEGWAELWRPEALRAFLHADLVAGEPAAWERAASRLEAWLPHLAWPEAAPARPAPAPQPAAKPAPSAEKRARLEAERDTLKAQLREARREVSRLQAELGKEHKRREGLEAQLADTRSRAQEESQRATAAKRKLRGAATASDREAQLERKAEKAEKDLHVLQQKFAIVSEEREDLRHCLEDYDRFLQVPEEVVPSFRERPLTAEEAHLAARLAERAADRRPAFRVLVVGGGEPQHKHRDKFAEYLEVVGFNGSWRMAEYVSWHKEMQTLERDMRSKYDALVVLHWNRTTFTKRARDICNKQGQKPCLTCHYEGFVSLRQTLQECLRQLLASEERAA